MSTSIDGSARLWKLTDGAPLMNLDRSAVYSSFLFSYFPFGNGKQLLFVFVVGRGRGVYLMHLVQLVLGTESTSYQLATITILSHGVLIFVLIITYQMLSVSFSFQPL